MPIRLAHVNKAYLFDNIQFLAMQCPVKKTIVNAVISRTLKIINLC